MKANLNILFLILVGISCHNPNENKTNKTEEDSARHEGYRQVERAALSKVLKDICSIEGIEFINLYPNLSPLVSSEKEALILTDSLMKRGFKLTKWGRGNWTQGPRIVSYTMDNGQCECQIDKLYYTTKQKGSYKLSERIKCTKSRE